MSASRILSEAALEFLRTAVFGPEREAYWRHCLNVANHSTPASPNDGRIQELETEPAVRRRVALRIGELDPAPFEKRRLRDQLAAHAPAPAPRFADVAGLLAKLPLIAEKLPELPNAELRRLFEALPLTATYHHDRKEVDIQIRLHERGLDSAQVRPVPPVGAGPDLSASILLAFKYKFPRAYKLERPLQVSRGRLECER